MRYIVSILLLLQLNNVLQAQDFSAILQSIEEKSTRLAVARIESAAEKAEASKISVPDDPEVGFNYLFGRDGIGNRWDLNVSQTLDFPSVIVRKRKVAREMQRVSDLKYLSTRQQVLLAARKLCIEVVYCNAMMEHLNEDLEETRAMAAAYEVLFEKGEATVIDHNKAHQALLFFETEYNEFMTMKQNLLMELQCLNGGEKVLIEDTVFTHIPLQPDFDQWLAEHLEQHPDMQLAQEEKLANEQTLKMERSKWAPALRVGYMGEFARDEKYQGPSVGLSVPLWGNRKNVKAAQMHLAASELAEADLRMHLVIQLQNIYRDALQLQDTYHRFHTHLTHCDNSELLRKSLEVGQITLLTYLQELQYVHEVHEKLMATERDLELRKAELIF